MIRFKRFPRNRRASLGELLGLSQASHQVSRKHLSIVRGPMSPLKNADRKTKRYAGYYSPHMQLVRLLRRLFQ